MTTKVRTVALLSPTGKFGPFLLKAFENEGYTVTAIVRQSSQGNVPSHIKTIKIGDEYPKDEVVAAFKGHDAVVLSLAVFALDKALGLADASIEAGVPRLIGSFYGGNLEDRSQDFFPINASHLKQLQHLRQLQEDNKNWSWTAIVTGPFTDLLAQYEMFGIHPSTSTAELLDGGKKAFTTSTRAQSALATARVLRNLEKTQNKLIYISSFENNLLEYLEAYKIVTGVQNWNVTSMSEADFRADSEKQVAGGDMRGMGGLALSASAGNDHDNHFSKVSTLANGFLDLPKENLQDVLKQAMKDGPPAALGSQRGPKQ